MMSMNIHFSAGKVEFPCQQTSTSDTRKILRSKDPVATYIDVWKAISPDHCKKFLCWVSEMKKLGFQVEAWDA